MKKSIIHSLIPILLCSCSNYDIYEDVDIDQDKLSMYDVVLQERGSEIPDKWDRYPRSHIQPRSGSNDFMPDDYLGYSYKVTKGNGIIGDQDNTGYRVIDTELILSDRQGKDIIKNQGFNESFNDAFSYSDFSSYYTKSKTVKSFNTGFKLNIKILDVGHSSKVTKTFIKERTKIKNAIYGEVNAGIRTGMHTMKTTDASIFRISSRYLSSSFLEDLYYTPMSRILSNYGEFVLTGYFSGGRAHAEYIGSYDELITKDFAGKEMEASIDATYKWESGKKAGENGTTTPGNQNSVYGNYGWGRQYERMKDTQSKIKTVYFTFKAIGGDGIGIGNTNPATVDDVNINLDSWIASLSTPSNQKLIEVLDKGLTGINVFMLEQNFKQRFQDTHLDLCRSDEFYKVRIEIVRIPVRLSVSGVQLYDIVPILYNRYGDLFILNDDKASKASDAELLANNNENIFYLKSEAIASEKAKYYKKIGITSNFKKTINPRLRYPLSFKLTGLDEGRMKKFYNEDTQMWYIYDEDSLVAYAFWYDTYILSHYGLTNWFREIQEEPISMISLSRNFKIYGL